jgi:heat shock protein HslJ
MRMRLALVGLLLAGCSSAPDVAAAPTPTWGVPMEAVPPYPQGRLLSTAVKVDGATQTLLPGTDGPRFSLTFDQGLLRAETAGCAPMEAPVQFRGGRLRLGALRGVEADCPAAPNENEADQNARAAQHRRLAAFLAEQPAYAYEGERRPNLRLSTRTTWMAFYARDVVQPEVVKPLGSWSSTAVLENGVPRYLPPDTHMRMLFDDSGLAIAYSGCNWQDGRVRFSDGRVRFVGESSTAIGCTHSQDAWLLSFLEGAPTYTLDGERLVLANERARIEFGPRDVVEPYLPLTQGTRWELEGTWERPPPGPMPKAGLNDSTRGRRGPGTTKLSFTSTRVRGRVGCTRLRGPVSLGPGTVTIGALSLDRSTCPGSRFEPPIAAGEWMLRFLGGKLTVEILDRRITLRNPSTGDGAIFSGSTPAERAASAEETRRIRTRGR